MVTRRRLCEIPVLLFLCLAVELPPKESAIGAPPRASSATLCVVPSPPEDYAVSVTPDGGSQTWPANTTGHTATFTVTNTGICQDTYNFSPSSSGPITVVSVSPSSHYLLRGGNTPVTVTYNVGRAGTGSVTLSAYGTDGPGSDDGYYNVTVNPVVTVTPYTATAATRAPNSAGYTETFTVQNRQAISDTIVLSCSGSTNVTCTGATPSGLRLAAGASAQVAASYYTLLPGTGTLRLIALASIQSGDTGTYSVPVAAPTVLVTPDAAGVTALPNAAVAQRFAVQNFTSAQVTYNLSVACSGMATNCSQPTPTTVAPGATSMVTVSYQTGSAGSTGTVKLTATNAAQSTQKDSGWVNVTAGGSVQTPTMDVASVNPGSLVERGACLTIAAGAAAAAECGDLRIVHPLPTTRTRSKARTPTLLYNSQFAHPYPLVAANVTLPAGAATPDSVVAVLHDSTSNAILGRGSWAGSDWVPGTVRRVVVGYDALSQASGIYSYKLELFSWYGGSAPNTLGYGQFAVVNRSASHFGVGWWLAGLERIDIATKVWYGGDGSVRRYLAAGSNVWAAPSFDRPDTLKWDGTSYVRYVTHGVRVRFDTAGKHVATVNRLGDSTVFTYNGDTLKTITLPPAGSGLTYQFGYSSGYLLTVTPPPAGQTPRTITLTASGGQVTAIRGPDTTQVRFSYDPGFANRIVARTDRRAFTTNYAYDAGGKVSRDSLYMGAGQTPLVAGIRSFESLGFAAAVDTARAYARVDGPRVDVLDTTAFWLDRFSQPRRVVNALGFETILTRGNGTLPALVTKVRYPNTRVVTATYDGRGNITSTTDSSVVPQNGKYATTRFVWNTKWDFDSVVAPPEGDSIVKSYDASNGNRVWQQDARGPGSQVTFGYNAVGLLQSIAVPSVSGTQYFYYDHLGNDSVEVTPKGFKTVVLRDVIGRDTLHITPADSLQAVADTLLIKYDAMGRDTFSLTVGPAKPDTFHYGVTGGGLPQYKVYSTPRESLYVRKVYDPNGNLTQMWRLAGPDVNNIGWGETQFQYDAANRKIVEIAADTGTKVDSTYYDPAGNVVAVRNREARRVTMTYDALNRLSQRIKGAAWDSLWPSVNHDPARYGQTLPRYYVTNGPQGWGVTVPGDTARFTYDSMGQVRTADNRDARVRRNYTLNGLLAADTLIVMPWTGTDSTLHVYGLRFGYDLDGRRKWLKHPNTIAPRVGGAAKDSVSYTYAVNGQLASVTDVLGNPFRWVYDAAGRPDTLYYPGSIWEHWTYDADSRVTERVEHAGAYVGSDSGFHSAVFHDDTYLYDARGKILQAIERFPDLSQEDFVAFNAYTALGTLARSGHAGFGQDGAAEEGFHPDALGRNERTWTGCVGATCLGNTADSANNVHLQYYYRFSGAIGHTWLSCVVQGCNNLPPLYPIGADYIVDSTGDRMRQRNYGQMMTAGGVAGQAVVSLQNYADGGGQIRFADRQACDVYNQSSSSYGCYAPAQIGWLDRGSFEDYRYDALGRRVLVRSRADTTCQYQHLCQSTIQRTVWDGDQILYEIHYPGADTVSASSLERDTVFIAVDSAPYGRVVYTHGLGIDQPLDAVRIGYSVYWPGPVATVLHVNWRGVIDRASFDNGTALRCIKRTNGTDSTEGIWTCVNPDPAATLRGAYFNDAYAGSHASLAWFGNIIALKRDATGQFYMRNRYYDPNSGQFTQEDPLGLAGGLNLYGFAKGDPINFSDPFGLKPCPGRIAKLKERVARIRTRTREYLDAHKRGIADQDHLNQLEGEQQGFNNDMDAYHREGCDDDDDDFRNLRNEGSGLARAPLPQPQMRYGPDNYPFSQAPADALRLRPLSPQETAAAATGITVAGVLLWLLSLAPAF